MEFKELEKNWNQLGKNDPFWAILSDPAKKGGKWDINEFFESGRKSIPMLMAEIGSLGVDLQRRRALDFGCGAGRLTQALCEHFDEVSGVDIAESMIELASQYNKYGERCKYYLNKKEDLRIFENDSFDFVISIIVLQHMRPEYSKNYIKEFMRVLAPGGLAFFQIPGNVKPEFIAPARSDAPSNQPTFLDRFFHAISVLGRKTSSAETKDPPKTDPVPDEARIEMYGIPKDEVLGILKINGEVIRVAENAWAGKAWDSYSYFVRKK